MKRPSFHILVVCSLLWSAYVVAASTVYSWVDEHGKVHYADVVPERYKDKARPVKASAAAPSSEDQRAAMERAQRDKARAQAHSAASSAAPQAPANTSSQPSGKRPSQVPNDRTDCATWQRLYEESAACFGPYRTVRGGVKPEAFDVCNEVPEPPPARCRVRIP